jgi:hypothetical protein
MRAPAALAALALLLAGSLAATGLPLPPCGAPEPLATLRSAVQDDAGTGGDAADCREGASLLGSALYHWGTLEGEGPALDGHDWFIGDVAAVLGAGSWARLNATADRFGYHYQAGPLPQVPVVVEAYAPGAALPFATLHSCGDGAEFRVLAGLYAFHVLRPQGEAALPCLDGAPFPPMAGSPSAVHDYGFYYGCHPHCLVLG